MSTVIQCPEGGEKKSFPTLSETCTTNGINCPKTQHTTKNVSDAWNELPFSSGFQYDVCTSKRQVWTLRNVFVVFLGGGQTIGFILVSATLDLENERLENETSWVFQCSLFFFKDFSKEQITL